MMLKRWRSLLCAAVLVILSVSMSLSQGTGRTFWLSIKDDFAPHVSVMFIFGNWSTATFGFDSLLPNCKEVEAPPVPPSFDIRWANVPGHTNQWGLGLLKIDYRAFNTGGKDTFVVQFQN